MGARRFRIVPLLVVAIAASSAAAPPGATATGGDRVRRIRARVIEGRLLVLPVTVNGTGPHDFLLDTGATSSIVDVELARELGLADVGVANQVSPNGARSVRLAQAALKLGSVEWQGLVLRAPLMAVRAVDRSIRGVVGQDVLRLANWWIDYRFGIVVEDAEGALSSTELGERLALQWQSDRPTIDVLLPDHGTLRLVLDSAATAPLLFRHTVPPGRHAGTAVLETHEGETTIPLVSVGPLRAGRSMIPVFAAGFIKNRRHRGEDGLLPTAFFDGLYFDNRAGTVVLNPRRSVLP
jgi:predicted aspartyl protease